MNELTAVGAPAMSHTNGYGKKRQARIEKQRNSITMNFALNKFVKLFTHTQ